MASTAATKLAAVRDDLKRRFAERDEFIDGALAALLARQHVLIIGPPGSAKSMIAHALCSRISGAVYFHWLLTKFSTPEELFGPVSLRGLEQDRYYRMTDGKLPTAHVAFLDEIFKANSAILNALLTLVNERIYYNDATPTPVPLNTLFGASNELPQATELECLADRFLFRYRVDYIEDREAFRSMLEAPEETDPLVSVTLAELRQAQAEVTRVTLGERVTEWLTEIRTRLRSRGMSVSDRRFRLSLAGLKANAYLSGRNQVNEADLAVLSDILWTLPQERPLVEEEITAVVAPALHAALEIVRQAEDVHRKALQSWFNREEERAAVTEAKVKLERLSRRLENLRVAQASDFWATPIAELQTRLGHLAGAIERRADELDQATDEP